MGRRSGVFVVLLAVFAATNPASVLEADTVTPAACVPEPLIEEPPPSDDDPLADGVPSGIESFAAVPIPESAIIKLPDVGPEIDVQDVQQVIEETACGYEALTQLTLSDGSILFTEAGGISAHVSDDGSIHVDFDPGLMEEQRQLARKRA